MRPLVIVNPRSQGGRTGATFGAMRGVIERFLGPVDVALTEASRHAVDIARCAAQDGVATVISVGGDGSIHEVANGLLEAREAGATGTRLGIIGQGTGGDFRRTLGLEHRLDHYCQTIADGRTRLVDVGKASFIGNDGAPARSYFVNILSVGMGGLVDRYVADMSAKMGGTLAYFLASVRGLVQGEVGRVRVGVCDEGVERSEELDTRLLAICNGRFFGGGMKIAPMAELGDGAFEVVDLGASNILRFAWVNTRIYDAGHLGEPEVRHYRCEKITVELLRDDVADKFLLDVDGEPLGRLPLTVELVPQALEVFAP
jgi:diacylglycerol kinase (ATP)